MPVGGHDMHAFCSPSFSFALLLYDGLLEYEATRGCTRGQKTGALLSLTRGPRRARPCENRRHRCYLLLCTCISWAMSPQRLLAPRGEERWAMSPQRLPVPRGEEKALPEAE